jgi:hypothetical protein
LEHHTGYVTETDLMKSNKDIRPPGWATRFLNWYCRREVVEDLEGDLNEYFERNVKTKRRQESEAHLCH